MFPGGCSFYLSCLDWMVYSKQKMSIFLQFWASLTPFYFWLFHPISPFRNSRWLDVGCSGSLFCVPSLLPAPHSPTHSHLAVLQEKPLLWRLSNSLLRCNGRMDNWNPQKIARYLLLSIAIWDVFPLKSAMLKLSLKWLCFFLMALCLILGLGSGMGVP